MNSFSLLGSALGFFLLVRFSLTPSGFCTDYRWVYILVRDAGRWQDGWGLFWRRMMISHVCSCVCFLTLGLVADGTVSDHWTQREHSTQTVGCMSTVNGHARTCSLTCQWHAWTSATATTWIQVAQKPWKRITMCLSKMWRWLAVMLQACWCTAGSALGTSAWQRAWTHEVL